MEMNEIALFWARFLHAGVIFIGPAFLHFAYALVGAKTKKKKLLLTFFYIYAFFLLALNFSGLLVKGVSSKFYFKYYAEPGPLANKNNGPPTAVSCAKAPGYSDSTANVANDSGSGSF